MNDCQEIWDSPALLVFCFSPLRMGTKVTLGKMGKDVKLAVGFINIAILQRSKVISGKQMVLSNWTILENVDKERI